jgi:hypothetical protein
VQVQTIEADIVRVQTSTARFRPVPWSATGKGRDAVQPCIEVRRLMHVFRIVAHRAEAPLWLPALPQAGNTRDVLTHALSCTAAGTFVSRTLHVTPILRVPYKTRLSPPCVTRRACLDSHLPRDQPQDGLPRVDDAGSRRPGAGIMNPEPMSPDSTSSPRLAGDNAISRSRPASLRMYPDLPPSSRVIRRRSFTAVAASSCVCSRGVRTSPAPFRSFVDAL